MTCARHDAAFYSGPSYLRCTCAPEPPAQRPTAPPSAPPPAPEAERERRAVQVAPPIKANQTVGAWLLEVGAALAKEGLIAKAYEPAPPEADTYAPVYGTFRNALPRLLGHAGSPDTARVIAREWLATIAPPSVAGYSVTWRGLKVLS